MHGRQLTTAQGTGRSSPQATKSLDTTRHCRPTFCMFGRRWRVVCRGLKLSVTEEQREIDREWVSNSTLLNNSACYTWFGIKSCRQQRRSWLASANGALKLVSTWRIANKTRQRERPQEVRDRETQQR